SDADYRVRVASSAAHPDLRITLVERVDESDFALVDDAGAPRANPCTSAGLLKTVSLVDAEGKADLTVGFAPEGDEAAFKLFVHSSRFGHHDAAALFAVMRREQSADRRLTGSR